MNKVSQILLIVVLDTPPQYQKKLPQHLTVVMVYQSYVLRSLNWKLPLSRKFWTIFLINVCDSSFLSGNRSKYTHLIVFVFASVLRKLL